jgi:hypothetical protein
MPESGLYQNVKRALLKLSRADLHGLAVIVSLKSLPSQENPNVEEAKEEAGRTAPREGRRPRV